MMDQKKSIQKILNVIARETNEIIWANIAILCNDNRFNKKSNIFGTINVVFSKI